jgi:hypothetical protein
MLEYILVYECELLINFEYNIFLQTQLDFKQWNI